MYWSKSKVEFLFVKSVGCVKEIVNNKWFVVSDDLSSSVHCNCDDWGAVLRAVNVEKLRYTYEKKKRGLTLCWRWKVLSAAPSRLVLHLGFFFKLWRVSSWASIQLLYHLTMNLWTWDFKFFYILHLLSIILIYELCF